MRRILGSITLAVAAAFTLAACGSNEPSTSSTSSSSSDFNDADASFAQSMIPHHQQAVQMAEMAKTHASTPEVKELADAIAAAQAPEIDAMTGWLESWGEEVPASDMGMEGDTGGMDHDMDSMGSMDMPGMMGEDEMKDLDSAVGATFDRMWLTMMIKHHEGAIEMARTEQAQGQNTDAVALAKKIETDQTAEIAEMKDLLAS